LELNLTPDFEVSVMKREMSSCAFYFLISNLGFLCLSGCESSISHENPRTDRNYYLTFNDTDARKLADQLTVDALERNWLPRFQAENGRDPIICVCGINLDMMRDRIDPQMFYRPFEEGMINSGHVRVLQERELLDALRAERLDTEFSNPAFVANVEKLKATESKPDLLLMGDMTYSREVKDSRRGFVYYQLNCWLVDVKTREKVWLKSAEVKKAKG
jgi:hypothetical protein